MNTRDNHLQSNKHKQNESKQKVIDQYNQKHKKIIDHSLYKQTCLFCPNQEEDMDKNFAHMS